MIVDDVAPIGLGNGRLRVGRVGQQLLVARREVGLGRRLERLLHAAAEQQAQHRQARGRALSSPTPSPFPCALTRRRFPLLIHNRKSRGSFQRLCAASPHPVCEPVAGMPQLGVAAGHRAEPALTALRAERVKRPFTILIFNALRGLRASVTTADVARNRAPKCRRDRHDLLPISAAIGAPMTRTPGTNE